MGSQGYDEGAAPKHSSLYTGGSGSSNTHGSNLSLKITPEPLNGKDIIEIEYSSPTDKIKMEYKIPHNQKVDIGGTMYESDRRKKQYAEELRAQMEKDKAKREKEYHSNSTSETNTFVSPDKNLKVRCLNFE